MCCIDKKTQVKSRMEVLTIIKPVGILETMSKTITLSELNKLLEDVIELQDVVIEGDLEIELAADGVDQGLMQAAGYELAQIATRLGGIASMFGHPVGGMAAPTTPALPAIPQELIPASFEVDPVPEWKHTIEEVTLGATSSDGGTRKSTVTLGGENALPYYFDAPMPHRNYISIDVFDMPITMATNTTCSIIVFFC